ncbi:putative Haloacid dehalogenase-like hydrolase domain-containing protein 3 [Hypsibius exemplaris]|uniref:Haloacid dehalogenase-like hydrolase domain-containing protein 3 n=1 Tax=Hypsibius exemplaris TaxID=2072580 RepID=A0A1W0XC83_HYPEX|nr:putative Haloacid dehalogenase-like hydrolase domain-containing protein 3 [Hypsibius exemplaris]
MSKLKLITFDITNTILRARVPVGEEYAKVACRFGLNLDAARISQEFPKVFSGLWAVQPNFGVADGITARQWWSTAVMAAVERSDVKLTEENFEKVSATAEALFEHYATAAPWMVDESSTYILSSLKRTHQLGIISNFDERLENLLEKFDLQQYFSFAIASRAAGVCKPDPTIFDLALQKAGIHDPSTALHVGDDLALDFKAAKSAGWNAVWFCSDQAKRHRYPVDETEVIAHLHELLTLPLLQR